MASKRSGIGGRIAALILTVLLIGGIIALIYHFTDGFNEDFTTFNLRYQSEDILTRRTKMTFRAGNEETFEVVYPFELDTKKDYSVRIAPNAAEAFDFTLDGIPSVWDPETEPLRDISSVFQLKKESRSFTISIPQDLTVMSVLGAVYPDKEIAVPQAEELEARPLYTIEVSSENSETVYSVIFSVITSVGEMKLTSDEEGFRNGVLHMESDSYFIEHVVEDAEGNPFTDTENMPYIEYSSSLKAGDPLEISCRSRGTRKIKNVQLIFKADGSDIEHAGDYAYSTKMPASDLLIVITME